jgi:hypothetical protein
MMAYTNNLQDKRPRFLAHVDQTVNRRGLG